MANTDIASLLNNSQREGTYRMLTPGTKGNYVMVPYSNVPSLQQRGFVLDDGEIHRYQGDVEAAHASHPLHTGGQIALDVVKGIGKGALTGVSVGDRWAREHLPPFFTNSNLGFGHPADLDKLDEMKTAHNTAQRVGKGIEQTAEFLIPAGGEAALAGEVARLIPKAAPIAGIAASALGSGLVNKYQGQSFGEGALWGAGGHIAADAIKKAAPYLATRAMDSRLFADTRDKATKVKDIGEAILKDTTGIDPGKIVDQAKALLTHYQGTLESAAKNSPLFVDLDTVRNTLKPFFARARRGNQESVLNDLNTIHKQLSSYQGSGASIPNQVSVGDALGFKDGLDGLSRQWGKRKELQDHALEAVRDALHDSLKTALPEYEALQQRISALHPVAHAQGIEGLPNNIKKQFADNLVDLVKSGVGYLGGLELADALHGGAIPHIAAGAAGAILPKLIPESHVLMSGARAASSTSLPAAARIATGATLAGVRGPQRWMDNGARNLALSGIDDDTINKLRATDKGQQTLMEAGDLSFGSRRLAAITNRLLQESKK
ncbi:hypothetical protein FTW19_23950 [Terriglobus albidus]|uniref:Uncharacterized protein n=1 Tax=Terriglobus albidus TaxID=1592106 RepID=A0A5B9EFD1_9BACT|nr:hypothetical protein [Terriglobus albidus]QEE30782.1 hypothetical protein FTW19_23950 [Terriglobus albidus]